MGGGGGPTRLWEQRVAQRTGEAIAGVPVTTTVAEGAAGHWRQPPSPARFAL